MTIESAGRLDLRRVHATNFAVNFELERSTRSGGLLGDDVVFTQTHAYVIGKIPHFLTESVRSIGDPPNPYKGSLSYFAMKNEMPGYRPRAQGGDSSLSAILIEGDQPITFECSATFEVESESEVIAKMWLPLPIPIEFNDSRFPAHADEIRGVRAVKFTKEDPSEIDYQFILDRPTNEEFLLHLYFDDTTVFTPGSTKEWFRRAARIAKRLIKV